MAGNKAMLPLYLNSDMAKNLLTVILFEATVDKQSISIKDQLKVNIRTPLNELAYNAFGLHMQGELNVEAASEFVNTLSHETINADILVFLKARNALSNQNLIKNVGDLGDTSKLNENDYVEFSCNLKQNPAIEQVDNIINMMEMQRILNLKGTVTSGETGSAMNEVLNLLKSNMGKYKSDKCMRFVAENIGDSKSRAIVPIQSKCMIDNLDYMFNGKVGVIGKVVRVVKDTKNQSINLLNGTCFEHLTDNHIDDLLSTFLPNSSKNNFTSDVSKENAPSIEVLPIMIYV